MYLSATNEKLQIVLSGAVNTNQLNYVTSFQDITSSGMSLPQSSSQGNTNNTTDVDMVAAPAASTTRQVAAVSIFNADVATAEVTVKKDVGGTEYILVKQTLSPGDTLVYTWSGGWQILAGTGSVTGNFTFSVFYSSGTYTKPAGIKMAHVVCVGAGGGGGAGRRGAAGTNRGGGGGGGGGAVTSLIIPESSLSPSVSVTIGAGGTGGTATTSDDTTGANGASGGSTSFGGSIIAAGGGGGTGGNTSGAGGSAANQSACTPAYGPYALPGAIGGSGATNAGAGSGSTGYGTGTSCYGSASGGGGGGINSSNTSATAAGAGGGVYQNGTLVAGPINTSAGDGSDNKSVFMHLSQTLTSGYGIGTGGAGGYPSSGKYDGGNGGKYGAGGGGGSASLNGTNSGKGGDGGGGLCVVMNIF